MLQEAYQLRRALATLAMHGHRLLSAGRKGDRAAAARHRADLDASVPLVLALAGERDRRRGRWRLAAGGADGAGRFTDAATGEELRVLRGHRQRVTALVFTPDGKAVISGSHDGTVRLWDVAGGKELAQFDTEEYAVLALALSPDGRKLALGGQLVGRPGHAPIFFWDVAARKAIPRKRSPRVAEESDHGTALTALAYSPDG